MFFWVRLQAVVWDPPARPVKPRSRWRQHNVSRNGRPKNGKAAVRSLNRRGNKMDKDMGVSLNGGTPKTPQNDHF